ncbi:MAG: hypothetical protein NVS2B7_11430 [Herpetosiphon sp.]
MENGIPSTTVRERVLNVAEDLFARRGYASVTLRDIAAEVGIRQASLYHHVPGGKEQLFVEVTERHFLRHRAGLTEAMAHEHMDIRQRLYAAAEWLLGQQPIDLIRMVYSDMPAIDADQAVRLSRVGFEALLRPIESVLQQAQAAGEIRHEQLRLVAGSLVGMIESLFAVPAQHILHSRLAMAKMVIDIMLDGLRPQGTLVGAREA